LKSYIITKYIAPPGTKKYLTVKGSQSKPQPANPNKMPHPHFRTTWEENSYWKHYTNYMESKMEDEAYYLSHAQQQQKQPPAQQPPAEQQSEGWTLVTRGRRRGQKK
jgi:hypothetical protein